MYQLTNLIFQLMTDFVQMCHVSFSLRPFLLCLKYIPFVLVLCLCLPMAVEGRYINT